MALLPDGLLEIMQCPACRGPLVEREEPPSLVCTECAMAYPVAEGGIPVMLEEAAQPLED
ncbi:MAG: Trm112 family protein [Acidimicrobiia bacterium]|nr:Trm112 family protein [Acidimicrobiia bacterium]